MPRRLPSSSLDKQTQITASDTGAVFAGTWYIGTGGAGSGGAVAGTLNGPLAGTADSAKVLTPGKQLNGQTFTGGTDITVPLNTTSIATSGTYYPTFVPSNTAGNQQASTNASLSYDPNTGYLSATRFVGSGTGLTGVVKSISFNGAAAVDGAVSITSPAQVQPDWNAASGLGSILNKPALFSGSYTDLTSKPALFSGSYTDLTNKPTIPAEVTAASLGFEQSLYANPGYQKFPGGLIMQWGYTEMTNQPMEQVFNITFAITFTVLNCATATINFSASQSAGYADSFAVVSNLDVAGMTVISGSTANGNRIYGIMWTALGR